MSKKILLVTGTTDILRTESETDATMEEVFELTLPSKQRYAKMHGYDLLTLRSFGSTDTGPFGEKNIGFLRMLRCFQYLTFYDSVMWIDADSLITNPNLNIDDFVVDDKCFYASWDWTGTETISTGNFIINKTKDTQNFLNGFLTIGKHVLVNNIWGEEQTTTNIIYRQSDISNVIKVLDHKYLGGVPSREMYGALWDGRANIPYAWESDYFLVHVTGISNTSRIDIFKNYFKEYL